MPKFTYGDTVKITAIASKSLRPSAIAYVVGVTEEPRQGVHFDQFPPGTVYLVEYADGVAVDIHESLLELLK